ncbi:MAG: hypothetical protein SOV56_02960 [Phascolarctobacterium sp.]|nr:hypothetical protein [Phascolarctobacterium sp.]
MLFKKFTAPCRVDYVPSPYEPNEEGVMDVGYKNGVMSDGRPYRLECWRMDELLMLTVLFSNQGLTGYKRADMPLLLEGEEILRFVGAGKPRLQAAQTTDDVGQSMWAINLMLADNRGTYAELAVQLHSYKL